MKKIFISGLFLVFSSAANSATFECQTFLNMDVISAQVATTELKVKTLVDQTEVAVSYLTEKADASFVLEVFLPYSQMRIYSEASVASAGQSITSTAWTRDYMIDVVCRKLN